MANTPATSRAHYEGPANLSGKIGVVTGGSQGLGEAIARLFAERGAAGLVICGRNAANGERVAEEISATGCPTHFVTADLAKVAECRKVIGRGGSPLRTRRHAGQRRRPDRSRQHLRHHRGTVQRDFRRQRARAVLPDPGGRADHAAREDPGVDRQHPVDVGPWRPADHTAYCASKGALATLTRNVANSLLKYRIRVNGLNIGWMSTPGEDRIMKTYHGAKDGWLDEAVKSRPFGRLIDPKEVARACAYLASSESGLMTGSNIDFDQNVVGTGDPPLEP